MSQTQISNAKKTIDNCKFIHNLSNETKNL